MSIPAPSPVLPSELTAPLCSSFSRISSALWIISLDFFPSRLQINPAPQLSCSNSGEYSPCFFSLISIGYLHKNIQYVEFTAMM